MPKGNGEAADTKTLDQIAQATWDETYGEDKQYVDDDFEHLGTPNDAEVAEEEKKADEGQKNSEEEKSSDDDGAQKDDESAGDEDRGEEKEAETSSFQAPDHWSEEDRSMFAELGKEAKEFLLRRHKQMEGDYTRKTQENAEAIKVGKLLDEAMDPTVRSELRRIGVDNEGYIRQMLNWHHMSVNDPVGFVRSITQQLRLDPAAVFDKDWVQKASQPPDPSSQRIEAIEQHLSREQADRQRQMVQSTEQRINEFRDAKNDKGEVVHPHFEAVRKDMAQFIRVDPSMDLESAYQAAVFKSPDLRQTYLSQMAPQQQDSQAERTKKALRAKQSNIKGRSGTVESDKRQTKNLSLTDALKSAADEIGIE